MVGPLPRGPSRVTLFGFLTRSACGGFLLVRTVDSSVFAHSVPTVDSLSSVIECCAGLGATSQGARFAGFRTVAHVEKQPSLAQLLQRNTASHVVVGDITDERTVQQVSQLGVVAHVVSAGVACQPYSRGGDGQSGDDPRAWSLMGVLRASWLWGIHMVIIECVGQALTDPFVQGAIQQYCAVTGCKAIQTTLQLGQVWAAKRERWWCIILPPYLPDTPIPRWAPALQGLQVRDVLHELRFCHRRSWISLG